MKISNILEPGLFDDKMSKAIYNKTDRQVERGTEIGYFVMAELTPKIWIWPKVMISFFIYFSTSLGHEAFALPHLMW